MCDDEHDRDEAHRDDQRRDHDQPPLLREHDRPARREALASHALPHAGQTMGVQEAFGWVLFGVIAVGAIVAVVTLGMRGRAYEQIGRGGLSLRDEEPRREPTGAVAVRERDDEIRQMLAARNARRAARGEEPLDVEAEVARQLRELSSS